MIKIKEIAQLKSNFVSREVDNELVLVPLTGNIAKMDKLFTLNETGNFLWNKLNDTSTEDSLIAALTEEFDVSEDKAKSDVVSFFEELSFLLTD